MKWIFLFFALVLSNLAFGNNNEDVCKYIKKFEAITEPEFTTWEEAISRHYLGTAETVETSPDQLQGGADVTETFSTPSKGWLIQSIAVELSHCYSAGRGTPQDVAKAIQILLPYESQPDSQAAHVLASLRLFRTDSLTDQKKGYTQLNWEFERGSRYAAGKLGEAQLLGLGVPQNTAKALELFEIAASGGMTYWQFLLAHAYEKGYFGFPVDNERKEYWLNFQPKMHIAKYECLIASYYKTGIFPSKLEERHKYETLCTEANKSLQPTADASAE